MSPKRMNALAKLAKLTSELQEECTKEEFVDIITAFKDVIDMEYHDWSAKGTKEEIMQAQYESARTMAKDMFGEDLEFLFKM